MLMYDQVARLRELGINTCYYNNLFTDEEKEFILHNLASDDCQYEFLFTSPEAALNEKFLSLLEKLKRKNKLSYIIIDEAHCIELWGGHFRENYAMLHKLKEKLDLPVVALTATDTKHTIEVIEKVLRLVKPVITRLSCYRSNLVYKIVAKEENKAKMQVADMIAEKFESTCGIVYCATRESCAQVALELAKKGVTATYFHGDLPEGDKMTNSTA